MTTYNFASASFSLRPREENEVKLQLWPTVNQDHQQLQLQPTAPHNSAETYDIFNILDYNYTYSYPYCKQEPLFMPRKYPAANNFNPQDIQTQTQGIALTAKSLTATSSNDEFRINLAELNGASSVGMAQHQTGEVVPKSNKTARDKMWWSTEEDEKLRVAVTSCGGKNWKLISEIADVGKSDVQCLQRWSQVLRPGLKKGSWSKEEDETLVSLVEAHKYISSETGKETIPWKKIEKYMGGRTAKQCRERWKLSLDPTINKMSWTREEDDNLLRLQVTYGNSWSQIKILLGTNRTENAVKLRYKCLRKRQDKHRRNVALERESLGASSVRSAPNPGAKQDEHPKPDNHNSADQPKVKRARTSFIPLEILSSDFNSSLKREHPNSRNNATSSNNRGSTDRPEHWREFDDVLHMLSSD